MTDEELPRDVEALRRLIDNELIRLNQASIDPRPTMLPYWSARLSVFSSRELSQSTLEAARTTSAASGQLINAIDRLSGSGERAGNRLAFWTGMLFGATLALAVATAWLVAAEFSHGEPTTIVIQSPSAFR